MTKLAYLAVEGRTLLPTAETLFRGLETSTGSLPGARAMFQALVTDLVGIVHLDVNEVAAPSGSDWGIDSYVGRLESDVAVWQSKYFPDGVGEAQKSQIRASFKEILKKAADEGFEVSAWTLALPCVLDPAAQKWWETWSKTKQRETKIRITLWNALRLRQLIMKDDASHIRQNYFGPGGHAYKVAASLAAGSNLSALDDTLFVRQLHEAGNVETDAARGFFFAAEALAREITARGEKHELEALHEITLALQGLWEGSFNSLVTTASEDGRINGLIAEVLEYASRCEEAAVLRLRPAHRKGLVHRLVESARAGWVRHWREVAAGHDGPPAGVLIEEQLATAVSGSNND